MITRPLACTLALLALASPAPAAFTYRLDLSAPLPDNGLVSAQGTITVQNLGTFGPSDTFSSFDWSLTLTDPSGQSFTLTRDNSTLNLTGSLSLTATAEQLALNIPQSSDEIRPQSGIFAFLGVASAIKYDFNAPDNTTTLLLQTSGYAGTSDLGTGTSFVVATAEPTMATPAPPGAVLAASAMPLLAGWAMFRRRAGRNEPPARALAG